MSATNVRAGRTTTAAVSNGEPKGPALIDLPRSSAFLCLPAKVHPTRSHAGRSLARRKGPEQSVGNGPRRIELSPVRLGAGRGGSRCSIVQQPVRSPLRPDLRADGRDNFYARRWSWVALRANEVGETDRPIVFVNVLDAPATAARRRRRCRPLVEFFSRSRDAPIRSASIVFDGCWQQ